MIGNVCKHALAVFVAFALGFLGSLTLAPEETELPEAESRMQLELARLKEIEEIPIVEMPQRCVDCLLYTSPSPRDS